MLCGLHGILLGESHHRPIGEEQGHATCSGDIHTFESGSWFGAGTGRREASGHGLSELPILRWAIQHTNFLGQVGPEVIR